MTDAKTKLTIYVPTRELAAIRSEAERLDRSLSWVLVHAWRLSVLDIASIPNLEAKPRPKKERPTDRRRRRRNNTTGDNNT